MSQSDPELAAVVEYMRAHWPSTVKQEWQVQLKEYPDILARAMEELTAGATRHHQLIRIAGISGAGKTTQVLPAAQAYSESRGEKPVLVAARRFVAYHPYYQEIKDFYGENRLREMTDEFCTIMMFMVLAALTQQGYDIILDVTLLDPKMEAILWQFLQTADYTMIILMIAVSPKVTERFLAGREWRHSAETEQEFIRSTRQALEFYAEKAPEARIVIWSVYHLEPEYDGGIAGALGAFDKWTKCEKMPATDDEKRRAAKIQYLKADSK